jgi:queuine/archaeosine tRNA-ribosyltransferase
MKYENVKQAKEEAERFVAKATELLAQTDEFGTNNLFTVVQGSASASARRASLELTKALSRMRASDWVEGGHEQISQ